MSSTVQPSTVSGTTRTTRVAREEQILPGGGARAVLAVTRILMGFAFVVGLHRQGGDLGRRHSGPAGVL